MMACFFFIPVVFCVSLVRDGKDSLSLHLAANQSLYAIRGVQGFLGDRKLFQLWGHTLQLLQRGGIIVLLNFRQTGHVLED